MSHYIYQATQFKKSIDTFTDTIGKDSILLRELMACVPYQNLLTQKHDLDNQAEREGAKLAEDKADLRDFIFCLLRLLALSRSFLSIPLFLP